MFGRLNRKIVRSFAADIQKLAKMQVSIRTPYKTLLKNCDKFTTISTKTSEATLIINNNLPASLYVLPPGKITVPICSNIGQTYREHRRNHRRVPPHRRMGRRAP